MTTAVARPEPRWPLHAAGVLVALQLIAAAGLGLMVAVRYPLWGPIDEGAHFSYVWSIAHQHRLPVIGRDTQPDEAMAITLKRYPAPSGVENPGQLGLAGQSYEAFQPPFYYLVLAPGFDLLSDYRRKARVLRGENLLLEMASALVLIAIARRLAGRRWPLLAIYGLLIYLLPLFALRGALLGPFPLETLLINVMTFLTLGTIRRHSRWEAVGAASTAGLLLMTKLTMALVAPVGILVPAGVLGYAALKHHRPALYPWAAACLLVPVAIAAPWLAWNEVTIHMLTGNEIAKAMQVDFVNPTHRAYTLGDLPRAFWNLTDVDMPQEWGVLRDRFGLLGTGRGASLGAGLGLTAPLLAVLWGLPGRARDRLQAAVLVFPAAALIVGLLALSLLQQWQIWESRYLAPAVPILALAFPWVLVRRGGAAVPPLLAAAALSVAVAATTFQLAGAPTALLP